MDANTCCCNRYAYADRCAACHSGIHSRCVGGTTFTCNCDGSACADHRDAHPVAHSYAHPDTIADALHANL